MTSEQMWFEMDADEYAEHQAYIQARREMEWD
jgi:hypothetical protein